MCPCQFFLLRQQGSLLLSFLTLGHGWPVHRDQHCLVINSCSVNAPRLYGTLEADPVSASAMNGMHVVPLMCGRLQGCLPLLELQAWFLKALLLSVRSLLPSSLANEVSGLTFPQTYSLHLGIPGYWAIISRGPNKPIKANDKEPN